MKFRQPMLIAACLVLAQDTVCGGVGQVTGNGRSSGSISVSSGGLAGLSVSSGATGARVETSASGSESTELIDFGDLSLGTGQPIQAGVSVAVRGNSSYSLNISNAMFRATTLRFRDRDIAEQGDRGSFISVRLGAITGTGARSNAARTVPNGALQNGVSLDQISQGPVTAESTQVCSGDSPSIGGTSTSADNALNVPIYFSVPTGAQLGPSRGAATGTFNVTVQLGAFPRR